MIPAFEEPRFPRPQLAAKRPRRAADLTWGRALFLPPKLQSPAGGDHGHNSGRRPKDVLWDRDLFLPPRAQSRVQSLADQISSYFQPPSLTF